MAQLYSSLLPAITCMFIVFTSDVTAKAVNYTDCGSQAAKIIGLDITPCDEEPCNMKRGTVESGILTFVPSEYITSGHVKAYAVIDGINIPLPISTDACQGYGLKCPLQKGVNAQFVIKQEIQEEFPTGKLSIKGEIMDPEDKLVVCFLFPIVIS